MEYDLWYVRRQFKRKDNCVSVGLDLRRELQDKDTELIDSQFLYIDVCMLKSFMVSHN